MKKIYLLLLLLPLLNLKAQTCYIDPNQRHEGISPDSATNFVSGTIGVAYTQNITVRVPKDTTVAGLGTVNFTTFNLESSMNNWGLPPGLSLSANPSNFQFPANDSSCMLISGTPTGNITVPTTYSLTFVIDVYGSVFGSVQELTTKQINYYHITINPAASNGISTNKGYEFNVAQNNPNPVINNTAIKFTSPVDAKAKMSVYNVTGQKVSEKEFSAQRGENSYDFDATTLENGIYLYSIELNGQRQIRRMVITK